ncbi:hypothetical protein FGIG_03522, partial [Fasciola gigantica]
SLFWCSRKRQNRLSPKNHPCVSHHFFLAKPGHNLIRIILIPFPPSRSLNNELEFYGHFSATCVGHMRASLRQIIAWDKVICSQFCRLKPYYFSITNCCYNQRKQEIKRVVVLKGLSAFIFLSAVYLSSGIIFCKSSLLRPCTLLRSDHICMHIQ